MNEIIKLIFNRRSIRNYQPEQIEDRELRSILNAGKYAPSAGNGQPCHFTVLQKKDILLEISEICRDIFLKSGIKFFVKEAEKENFNVYYNAPTVIILSGNEKDRTIKFDCALALGNMFLAAESLGIGSCWITGIKTVLDTEKGQEIKKNLGIPEGKSVIAAGAFGNKAESPIPAPRREGNVNFIK